MRVVLCAWTAVGLLVCSFGLTAQTSTTPPVDPKVKAMLEPLAMAEVFKLDAGMKAFRIVPLDLGDCTLENLGERDVIAIAVAEYDPSRRADLRRAILLMVAAPGWYRDGEYRGGLVTWQWVPGPDWAQMFAAYVETITQIRPVDGQVPVFISGPSTFARLRLPGALPSKSAPYQNKSEQPDGSSTLSDGTTCSTAKDNFRNISARTGSMRR